MPKTAAAPVLTGALEGLKPTLLWKYFGEISKIPRGSKNEAAIIRYVLDEAKRLGLEADSDEVGNVVVRKPASKGREKVRGVVLQGHLDMVCEKNKEKVHDFTRDPIELVRRRDFLTANGTTLGADNGIAVATNLAIMADTTLEHGPLEMLFTTDEETGLTGAAYLRADLLRHRTMINLDSEEWGAFYVGCSGGRNTTGTWKLATEPVPEKMRRGHLVVKGLCGGHSGLDIEKGRGNAIKILGRVLSALAPLGMRISAMEGGSKHNAIPREAEALVFIPQGCWDDAVDLVADFASLLQAEVSTVDPGLTISLERSTSRKAVEVLKPTLQKRLLQALAAVPHGAIKMSADLPGLVETSTNLAVLEMTDGEVRILTSQRSSVASENVEICDTVAAVLSLAGAKVAHTDGYPGWKPNLASPILQVALETYQGIHGAPPEVKAIHAGLECGLIGEKYPGMDMVSMGPTLESVHSPDERIHLDTVPPYWNLLLAILRNVK